MKKLTINYNGQSVLKELCSFDTETNEVESCKTCEEVCKYYTCVKCPVQI